MQTVMRDSVFGLTLNHFSNGKLFPFPEQRADFKVPPRYLPGSASSAAPTSEVAAGVDSEKSAGLKVPAPTAHASRSSSRTLTPNATRCPSPVAGQPAATHDSDNATLNGDNARAAAHAIAKVAKESDRNQADIDSANQSASLEDGKDANLVDWYGDDDPENPQNWSSKRKGFVTAQLMLLTFTVYIGSAIYTPSIPGVMEEYGVSQTQAILGLSLYVLGYGFGPLILSPLTEIPRIGRLSVYQVSLLLFTLFTLPTAIAPNFATLLVFRFLSGFVCSPALSTGGATIGDVFSPLTVPYIMSLWSAGAVAGPTIGPVVGGFAAQERTWRWPLYMLLFLAVFTLVVLSFSFPETSSQTILLRRAHRLRKLTGNTNLRSAGEIEQAQVAFGQVLVQALYRPIQLFFEPAIFFVDMYVALTYSVFYLWFEGFPIVFSGMHGFGLGASGLPFVGFIVALIPTLIGYCLYQKHVVIAGYKKTGELIPEDRLKVALFGSVIIPASLLIFGWTSSPDIHWIGPVIGASLYLPGIFLVFQGALTFLGISYQRYAASVLAGNALLRGIGGAVFPLLGHAFYDTLKVGPGSSLLAGLAALMIIPMYFLYKYGAKLRSMSKYATA